MSYELIRHAREAIGMSAEKLAREMDVSTATIRSWESGKTEPRLSQAVHLAAVLGFKPMDLAGE